MDGPFPSEPVVDMGKYQLRLVTHEDMINSLNYNMSKVIICQSLQLSSREQIRLNHTLDDYFPVFGLDDKKTDYLIKTET